MVIDRRFERIARRLSTLELVGEDDGEAILGELVARPGDTEMRIVERFAGYYSRAGVLKVLEAYGVSARLEELGLVPWRLRTSRDGTGRHRLEVILEGEPDEGARLVDLVVELRRAREIAAREPAARRQAFDALVVEWLALENPRASFSAQRPRLPGQRHPGLGLGRTVHNMILLMARRLGRAGVLNVPRHFHLAAMYDRLGYRFLCEEHQTEVRAVAEALRPALPMAAAAWAVERGFVQLGHHDGPLAEWSYRPVEMLAPVDEGLEGRLAQGGGWLRRLVAPRPKVEVRLDRDGLVASLAAEPVPGLDPSALRGV